MGHGVFDVAAVRAAEPARLSVRIIFKCCRTVVES